jgi:hypothetical protein
MRRYCRSCIEGREGEGITTSIDLNYRKKIMDKGESQGSDVETLPIC